MVEFTEDYGGQKQGKTMCYWAKSALRTNEKLGREVIRPLSPEEAEKATKDCGC